LFVNRTGIRAADDAAVALVLLGSALRVHWRLSKFFVFIVAGFLSLSGLPLSLFDLLRARPTMILVVIGFALAFVVDGGWGDRVKAKREPAGRSLRSQSGGWPYKNEKKGDKRSCQGRATKARRKRKM
jgi:hypothetical protein